MKKNIFLLLTMLMAAAMSVSFTSCSSDDDGDGANRDGALVGTWYETSHSYVYAWRFDSNGTCYYCEWMSDTPRNLSDYPYGKWSTNDGVLTIIDEGYDEEDGEYYRDEDTYTYKILEGGQTLELYEGSRRIYTLQKQ